MSHFYTDSMGEMGGGVECVKLAMWANSSSYISNGFNQVTKHLYCFSALPSD